MANQTDSERQMDNRKPKSEASFAASDCSAHDELAAIKRVLKLTDGYISTQNQDLLLAWGGGIMTWGELREHIQCVLKASVLNYDSTTDKH